MPRRTVYTSFLDSVFHDTSTIEHASSPTCVNSTETQSFDDSRNSHAQSHVESDTPVTRNVIGLNRSAHVVATPYVMLERTAATPALIVSTEYEELMHHAESAQTQDWDFDKRSRIPQPMPAGPVSQINRGGHKEKDLMIKKMDRNALHDQCYGRSTYMYSQNFERKDAHVCRRNCSNARGGSSCLHMIGGFSALLHVRRNHWWQEVEHPRKRYKTGATVPQSAKRVHSRGALKKRKIKLMDMLRAGTHVHANNDETLDQTDCIIEHEQVYYLPRPNEALVQVCKPFFYMALGYDQSSSAMRKAKTKLAEESLLTHGEAHLGDVVDMTNIPEAMMSRLERYKHLPSYHVLQSATAHDVAISENTGGLKTRMLLVFMLEYIEFYSEPMPHEFVLRCEFTGWRQMHETIMKEYELRDPLGWEAYKCTEGWLKQTLKHPLILDAIAIKTGCASHAEALEACLPNGSGGFTNRVHTFKCKPLNRKIMFGCCTRCADLGIKRKEAVLAKNAANFRVINELSRQHTNFTMNRKHKYYNNKKDALENPYEVLTIIIDGMSKWHWDHPVVPRRARHSKELKDASFYEYTPDGALVTGLETKFLFLIDTLIGGPKSGMNKTVDLVMRILDLLKDMNKIPTARARRVLNLQFDNCGVNKNYMVFVMASMLVHNGMFTHVNVDYMHVGHTHEDIDQWFSVLKQWFNTLDKNVATTEKLMIALRESYEHLHVEELLAIRDFATLLAPHAILQAHLRGHSKGFSYRFFKNSANVVEGMYQTDEDVNGQWYHMSVMRTFPDTSIQEMANMPLVKASTIGKVCGGTVVDRNGESRTITGVGSTIQTIKDKFKGAAAGGECAWFLLEDDEYWTEKLEHINDDAWVILNRQNVTPKHVDWGTIPNVFAEPREDEHTVESMLQANPQFMREAPGPCIQSLDTRGTESMADYLAQQWAQWHIMQRQEYRRVGICRRDLPRVDELVVFVYGDDSHHAGNDCFILGQVTEIHLTNEAGEDISPTHPSADADLHKMERWNISVKNYCPSDASIEYATDPKRFSEAKFIYERESEASYHDRMGTTRAGRRHAVSNAVDQAALMITTCMVPAEELLLWHIDLKTASAIGSIQLTTRNNTGGRINATRSKFQNIREKVAWVCRHYKCIKNDEHCEQCTRAIRPRNPAPSMAPRIPPAEATGLTAARYQEDALQGVQDDDQPRLGPARRSSGRVLALEQQHAARIATRQLMDV